MTPRLTTLAMRYPIAGKPVRKLVLVAIATLADDKTGETFASYQTIATRAGCSRRHAIAAIGELVTEHVVSKAQGRAKTQTNRLRIERECLLTLDAASEPTFTSASEPGFTGEPEDPTSEPGFTPLVNGEPPTSEPEAPQLVNPRSPDLDIPISPFDLQGTDAPSDLTPAGSSDTPEGRPGCAICHGSGTFLESAGVTTRCPCTFKKPSQLGREED